jgi:hypothetical protein
MNLPDFFQEIVLFTCTLVHEPGSCLRGCVVHMLYKIGICFLLRGCLHNSYSSGDTLVSRGCELLQFKRLYSLLKVKYKYDTF